jgi:hypothetical protein
MENINQTQEPQISLKDTKEVKCSCGSYLFQQAISLREVSALLTGTGRTEYVPVSIIVCLSCKEQFERPNLVTA